MRLFLALCASVMVPAHAFAQPCHPKLITERVHAQLKPGALLIDFCSTCNAKATVLRIARARIMKDCPDAGRWSINVDGKVLARSQRFDSGYDQTQAVYRDADEKVQAPIDPSNVYIEVEANRFSRLGKELGLPADVKTEQISLPLDTYRSLGKHPLAPIAKQKAKHRSPTPKELRRVWHHYRYGQGRGPILGELIACLRVDERRVSPTRFECLEPVEGPVPSGTRVYAWSAWLIPKGERAQITVEFRREDVVRQSRSIELQSLAPRQRSFSSARLSKPGRWTIVVKEGDIELDKASLVIAPPTVSAKP